MMNNLALVRDLMLAVHFLAASAWVGGMFYAVVVLRPAIGALEPAPRMQMHLRTLKRFFMVVWHAMPLMLLTGWGMIFSAWGGMSHLPWSINVMQALALIMAGIFLYAFFAPFKRLRRAIRPGPELLERIRGLIMINLVLGIVTIVIGSLGHVW